MEQISTHTGQHRREARPSRTGVYVLDDHLGPREDRRPDGPEGGLGGIAGDIMDEGGRPTR